MEHTTIDVLIARIETHPKEFFRMNFGSAELATCEGTKWDLLIKHLTMPYPFFQEEEIKRFKEVLGKKIRETIDVEIMQTIVTENDTFNPREREYKAQQAIAQRQSVYQQACQQQYQNAGIGQTVSSGNFAFQPQQSTSVTTETKKRSFFDKLFRHIK